jgi:sugar O-acyltransferase (sialic acid O-acetyltransferase NeuD family)
MSQTTVAIWGTGGFAREVLQIVEDCRDDGQPYDFVGFLDGNAKTHGTAVHGHPVLGDQRWLSEHPHVAVVIAVGNPVYKRRIIGSINESSHSRFVTLKHPRCWVGRRVELGEGSILCAGVMVTTDVVLGHHVILNLNTTVGHDAVLEDLVTVAPGVNVSGNVRIGTGTDVGTGSSIIQGISIGPWSVVGAGSVVVRDLPRDVTAVGVPARVIKTRDEGWQLR